MFRPLFIVLLTGITAAPGQAPRNDRYPPIHDPSTVVREDGGVWSLATGNGVTILRRDDAGRWRREGALFRELPAWHKEQVPGNRGHLWAPDLIRLGDRWFAYYSISTFGSNESAIGLAIADQLDPAADGGGWKDAGLVIRSRREDRFNAIDPALIRDADGRLWMSFGSFWNGIFLVELDAETGLLKDPEGAPVRLASHPEIEAPFIHHHDGNYYLFLNWGKCCRGVESTYEIRVGRSPKIEGPYLDKEGVEMKSGGGTLVLATEGRFIGPGHASIFIEDGKEMLVHHYYDRERNGRSDMRMLPLRWEDGWPVVGGAEDE